MSRRPAGGLAVLVLALAGCGPGEAPGPEAGDPVSAVMNAQAEAGYARATAAGTLRFPRDHGPHPDFRTEWWYFTGNLADQEGRPFGFQLTLFRFALSPSAPARTSHLASRQAWMGHLAVTDVQAGGFHAYERFSRGAAGLAGATARPFAVWIEDWRVFSQPAVREADPLPMRLVAAQDGVALDLVLSRDRPLVLQGDQGLSRKSAEPGNASYYYSYTRLPARGRLRTPSGTFQVHGLAWMDREWSTSALAPDQTGWDWFALQLDDGRDVMFYRLRDARGAMHPFSAGVIADRQGLRRRLRAADARLEPLEYWSSPSGARYPVSWRLAVADLDLRVTARLDSQEHRGTYRYWEGAVSVAGRGGAGPVSGAGYLEMTGY